MPHENDIMKLLDTIDESTLVYGSANTVINRNNELIVFNTDGMGFVLSLSQNDVNIACKSVVVLGVAEILTRTPLGICAKTLI